MLLDIDATYNVYKIVKAALDRLALNNEDWKDIKSDFETDKNDWGELILLHHPLDESEYVVDSRTLSCAIQKIYDERIENESAFESVLNRIKAEIISLAGGEFKIWINVYSCTRCYGGHQEGGWYYNLDEFKEGALVGAEEIESTVKEFEEKYGEGEGNIYSVLGGYEIHIRMESSKAESETKEIPVYE